MQLLFTINNPFTDVIRVQDWEVVDGYTLENLESQISLFKSENNMTEEEEFLIEDSEGFYQYDPCEGELDLLNICYLIENIEEYGEAFTHYSCGDYIYPSGYSFEDVFRGEFDSKEAFAESMVELENSLHTYFNFSKLADDLLVFDYWAAESEIGSLFIFRK